MFSSSGFNKKCIIEYKVGEIIKPTIKESKILCFDTSNSAYNWLRMLYTNMTHFAVYKAEAYNVEVAPYILVLS